MKVYVGNLPFSATEEEVRSKFEAFGPLQEVALITDRDTGRPRGFGFVTFENGEDAQSAISALDNTDMGGRNLKVNQAQERSRGGGGGGGRGGYGGGGGRDRGGYGGGGRDRY
ncbi:MAG: RNA-binding protein [Chrysiogenetes bacterium]|nr:RNA-binding protein [Chrysiogenetes bacterium]